MFSLLIDILLADTFILCVPAFLVDLWPTRGKRRGLRVLNKERRWLYVLFPWLVVVLWVERPARRLYRHRRRYDALFPLVMFGLFALLVWGTVNAISVLPDGSALILLWVLFLDLWLKAGGQDGGGGGRRHNAPTPTKPTPTADAADRWVRSRQSQMDAPSSLPRPRS